MKEIALPLKKKTPITWAKRALEKPLELLNDHAHLEKKAATNALDLLPRWPGVKPPARWVKILTAIARDEISHLGTVVRILEARGGNMTRVHKNQYANDLRALVRLGRGKDELIDRLMISSLIELRSCERFSLLRDTAEDQELKKLYSALWSSEHGHYKVFLECAVKISNENEANERFDEFLKEEGKIIAAQEAGARMHAWV